MTHETETPDTDRQLRRNINQDGLLDLFGGAMLVVALGLGALSQSVGGDPGMFAGISPLLLAFFFEPARRRFTYPRLRCPDYKPTEEIRFAVVVLTVLAALGAAVFLLATLAGVRVLSPLFEHAPTWAALGGAALCVVFVWWYRSRRFLAYAAVAGVAVAAGYLLAGHMLARMAILAGVVGIVMAGWGAVLFIRFRRDFPSVGAPSHGPDAAQAR